MKCIALAVFLPPCRRLCAGCRPWSNPGRGACLAFRRGPSGCRGRGHAGPGQRLFPARRAGFDDATSDGIFVFSSARSDVMVGDRVRVEGRVVEFTPPNRPQQLSLTEIAEPEVVTLASDAALPVPVLLGPGGRMPPTEVIDDDGMATFEPDADAIDFYESLEGMRVAVEGAIALNPMNGFGEVWAVLAEGSGATGFNGRDAIANARAGRRTDHWQLQRREPRPGDRGSGARRRRCRC